MSNLASSQSRPVARAKKQRRVLYNLQPVLHHAGVVSSQNWPTGERLCGGDANAMADELEPLWLTALLLRVPEAFGCYISLHSGRSARERERERERGLGQREREREKKRESFIRNLIQNGGSRAAPAHGLRITTLRSAWHSNSLHGEDFLRTLMRGSPLKDIVT